MKKATMKSGVELIPKVSSLQEETYYESITKDASIKEIEEDEISDESEFREKEFIIRRANGQTISQISNEMRMSKSTACALNNNLKLEIQKESAYILTEKLKAKKQTIFDRIEKHFNYREQIEKAIASKIEKLQDCELPQLFKMLSESDKQIEILGQKLTFTEKREAHDIEEEIKKKLCDDV